VALLLSVDLAAAQSTVPDPTSGLINPQAIVFNPANRKVYAVDRSHATVTLIDTVSQTVRSVAVGSAPVSITVDSIHSQAYVANAGDGTVSILDGTSDKLLATVAVGAHPNSIAANPRAGLVYVSHTFNNHTTVLDAATRGVTQLVTGSADLVAIDGAANTAYLLADAGGTLTVLEGAGRTLREEAAGQHAWAMAVDEATHTLYVARMGTGDVNALHGTSSSVFPAGHTPCAVAIDPRIHAVYVANYADGGVTILDQTGRSVATVPVGVDPQALAVAPQRGLIYVANTWSGTVTVIDAERRKPAATFRAGTAPYALAVDPGASRLYVANEAGDQGLTIVETKLPQDPTRKQTSESLA
jgi:YVTN family beta-propeller protein